MHFGLIILFYALVMGIFMYFMRQTIIVMSRKIEFDLRNDIYNHYLSLDTAFLKIIRRETLCLGLPKTSIKLECI